MDTVSQVDTLSTHVLLMHHLDIICEFGNLTNLVYNDKVFYFMMKKLKKKMEKERDGEEKKQTDRQR